MSLLASSPSLLSLLVSHWQPVWGLDAAAGVYVGLYLWGARRVRRRWPLRRTLSFIAGIAVVLVALQSGLDAYDDRLLSVHMLQHILLLMIAPPLLLLGDPLTLALRALPGGSRRTLALMLPQVRSLSRPGVCLAFFAVVLVGTHLPVFFDATLHSPLLHELEHAAFLLAGLLLWWPLTNSDPVVRHRLGGFGRIFYMIAAMVPEDLLGGYLNRANFVLYRPYAAAAHVMGISAVTDQQQAGAIMWVGSSCIMAAGGLCAAMAAMVAEEQRAQRRESYAAVDGVVALSEIAGQRGNV